MTTSSESDETTAMVDRLQDPDPFQLPRTVKQRVKCCTRAGCGTAEEVTYLWIDLSHADTDCKTLSLEDWLNVVDEAASLGVSWVVFSVEGSLSQCPIIWEVTRWAQDTYNMVVGFHSRNGALSPSDIESLKQLDLDRCHLFVAQEHLYALNPLKELGLKVHLADPKHDHREALCEMPGNMVFVNPSGALYTCGMVKKNQDYLLGNIMHSKLNHVVRDPSLPHAVPEHAVVDSHGCDGCPPLVVKHLNEG